MLRSVYKLTLPLSVLVLPLISFAQNNVCVDGEGNPVVCNPLQANSITGFLETVVDVLVTLSIPVIVVAIIYSGFLFVTAGGSDEQLDTAKKNAMYTLIGAGIIIGAELILTVLENTASGLGVGGL